jgi:hypothetical protein
MAGGRPLKFKSVKELQEKIDAYFADCDPHMEEVTEWVQARDSKGQLKKDENGLNYLVEVTHKVMTEQKPYTITGLALALDTSRETLLDYEEKQEFSDTIKKAKDRCHNYVENSLLTSNPTGAIFNLKNNYGWKDKTEQDITTGGEAMTALVEFADGKPKD